MSETDVPVTAQVEICNNKGLHARASAKFVKLVSNYEDTRVFVTKDGNKVDGDSILDLLMLAAGKGSTIEIEAEGPQAQAVVAALVELVENRFEEDA
ncbi:HPr kinase [Asticcacaulis sp. AC460]|uniref:HPr family phosphocarrier protein n=1 Tax=Asticcacaulis sp. AC460 TaxID=1282360 RepID=UPI0003C3FCFD|nr:HPr family phosphocarrier protein [Asticcacaulis sp. AC460]ESQ90942.1 HPr kinase [Asticcacaulis sp. AC460]